MPRPAYPTRASLARSRGGVRVSDIPRLLRIASILSPCSSSIPITGGRILSVGQDASSLPVIPMILHNETWQLAGAHEGIYIHDWSALTRFFEQPRYHATKLHAIDGKRIANQVPITSLWSGERPTPMTSSGSLKTPSRRGSKLRRPASCPTISRWTRTPPSGTGC